VRREGSKHCKGGEYSRVFNEPWGQTITTNGNNSWNEAIRGKENRRKAGNASSGARRGETDGVGDLWARSRKKRS